jgi:hypothetical protein
MDLFRHDGGMRTARPSSSRLLLVLFTWLVGVGVATAVGLGALRMIGDRVTDQATQPLSERAVDSAAAGASDVDGQTRGPVSLPRAGDLATASPTNSSKSAPPGKSSPRASSSPQPPSEQVRSFHTSGGIVVASCVGGRVVLRYAVPQDGYRSDVSNRGPERVEVEFEGSTHHSHISISCTAGVPTSTVEEGSGDGWGGGDR